MLPDRTMGPGAFLFGSRAMFHIVASWEANPAPAATWDPSRVILQYCRLVKVGVQNFRPMTAMHANMCNGYGAYWTNIPDLLYSWWLSHTSFWKCSLLLTQSSQSASKTKWRHLIQCFIEGKQPSTGLLKTGSCNDHVFWSHLWLSRVFQRPNPS
jgi:hypothetical protein